VAETAKINVPEYSEQLILEQLLPSVCIIAPTKAYIGTDAQSSAGSYPETLQPENQVGEFAL